MGIAALAPAVALFSLAPSAPAAAEPLPRGALVDKVVCADDQQQSYALYLPAAYTPDKRWPVLYALDARGHGTLAVQRFQDAAEAYGYVIAASNNSRSDEAVDPNTDALRAMWRDTHARFSIDDRRVYLTGFSGGARAAFRLAQLAPGTVAGVIACGAGFSPDLPPKRGLGFAVFGIAGDTDFNYEELQALDVTLAGLEIPRRIESFEGAHGWPPPAVCRRAVEWMEVQAIKEGRRSRDEALLDALLAKGVEEAGRLEAAGWILDGARAYEALARDFGGLRDATTASQASARLRGTAAYAQEAGARERSLQREREYMTRAPQALARVLPEEAGTSLGRVLSDLNISDLKKSAGNAKDREERLMARRLLESVFVQTSFYVPRALLERGDHRRAALSLRVAAEIKPEEPYVWYGLARAQARGGQKSEALKALRRAVQAGFRDAEALGHEPDFDVLRKERGYEEILAGLAGRNETAHPHPGEGR